jgi:hypothetical protein
MNKLISNGDYYGMPDKYTIDAGTYNHFLKIETILDALMKAGVRNFEGYDAAMELVQKELA